MQLEKWIKHHGWEILKHFLQLLRLYSPGIVHFSQHNQH